MRSVFLGTPAAAVPSLAALTETSSVAGVITQPDAARGRSGRLIPPPVAAAAGEFGLPVLQPSNRDELRSALGAWGPVDVAVVVAYGRLIPEDILAVPFRGFLNVHFSLLPRWRGASPVVRSLLAGDAETGVTLMELDAGLDTGPIVAAEATEVRADDTAGTLTARLAHRGAALLARHIGAYADGSLRPVPQEESRATAAAKVTTEEAHVDPTRHGAVAVDRAVRAFDPKPGAWTTLGGERLKLWKVRAVSGDAPEPGLADWVGDSAILGCRDGGVELVEVQPSGKGRMPGADWLRGRSQPRFSSPS